MQPNKNWTLKIVLINTLTIALLSFFCSCAKNKTDLPSPIVKDGQLTFDKKEDLIKFFNENENYNQQKQIGDFMFKCRYLSSDYLALNEIGNTTYDQKFFNQIKEGYSELLYFRLNISNPAYSKELLKYNAGSNHEYKERLTYASFNFGNDVSLIQGNDTIPCALYQFERTFDVNQGLNFLLSFKPNAQSSNYTLLIKDRLFNCGYVKLSFTINSKDLPILTIQ
jgi:hypothetical protein